MKELQFKSNINCQACIKKVSPFLNANDFIDDWKVDVENPDKPLYLKLEDDAPENFAVLVKEELKKLGYSLKGH